MISLGNCFVLIDPSTGRVIEGRSPSFRRPIPQEQLFQVQMQEEESNFEEDLPVFTAKQRTAPAPEYYAQDGKTPIYKIFKKNPYGR